MHLQKPMLGTQLDWSNPLNDGCVLHLAMNEAHGDHLNDPGSSVTRSQSQGPRLRAGAVFHSPAASAADLFLCGW